MSRQRKPLMGAVAMAAALLAACSGGNAPADPAAEAARAAYEHLAQGRYADFVGCMAGADSLPAAYREQLVAGAKQTAALVAADHGGIDSVKIERSLPDTLRRHGAQPVAVADVFLVLCFADSTREEIVVPMVERHNGWKMR